MDVALLVLEGMEGLEDRCLSDEVLSLRCEAGLAHGGGQVDSARVAAARRLHRVHQVVLDLVQLELDLVPGYGQGS